MHPEKRVEHDQIRHADLLDVRQPILLHLALYRVRGRVLVLVRGRDRGDIPCVGRERLGLGSEAEVEPLREGEVEVLQGETNERPGSCKE
jgi:hypothetical protein